MSAKTDGAHKKTHSYLEIRQILATTRYISGLAQVLDSVFRGRYAESV